MDRLYTAGLLHPSREKVLEKGGMREETAMQEETERVVRTVEAQTKGGEEEVMLLQRWNGKLIAEDFALPEMEIEIERAVEQVEKAIRDREKLVAEKKMVEQSAGESRSDR